MIHIKSLYYLTAFISSMVAISFGAVLAGREGRREDLVRKYFILILNLAVLSAAWQLHSYVDILGEAIDGSLTSFYILLENLALTCLIWSLPGFVHSLTDCRNIRRAGLPFLVISTATGTLFLLSRVPGWSVLPQRWNIYDIIYITLAAILVYGLSMAAFSYRRISSPSRRAIIRVLGLFLLIFIPLIAIDGFFDLYREFLIVSPAALTAFNVISIVLALKEFRLREKGHALGISDAFIDRYAISKRERDIIIMIAGGLTNRQISEKAYISHATVRTHINNIYRKTGVHDRENLFEMLKG